MSKHLLTAGLVLALGTFVAAETPRAPMPEGQSQNQNAQVQITQQPRVEFANQNSATISWSTNVQAGSVIEYGSNPNNLTQRATAPWGGTTHRVQLQNLQPGTTYYYRATSGHGSGTGTEAMSVVGQFTTAGNNQNAQYGQPYPNQYPNTQTSQSQNSAPVYPNAQGQQDNVQILAGPVVQNLQPTSATLWWQTDDRAANHVKYGTDPNNLSQSAYERGGSRQHTAELSNLQPGQTYYFQVMRQDGTVRTQGQFSTPSQNAMNSNSSNHISNGPVLERIGPRSATIAWTTPSQSSSIVRYGTSPNALNQTAQGAWGSNAHRVQLNNLQPNTRYYFEVISSQSGNVTAGVQSNTGQFQTLNQGQQAMVVPH